MNTLDCIRTRRSIRKFKPEKPDIKTIQDIILAASFSPSWKNTQITRYIYIQDDFIKSEIASKLTNDFNASTLNSAPALMVITAIRKRCGYERDGSFSTVKGDSWQMFDAGVASQTFCLAAHEYGLGTVIMGIFDYEGVRKLLDIPEDREVIALIPIGYPDISPEVPKRKTVEDLLIIK